ncbi:PREDICTED: serine/threonine-protein phosphatase 6 regulatory subunit 3 isoform X1 [Acromyrmex echinatior]|uniref:Serine/threonine-protein phosphatase 6 regulatory subunit 2 n=1 Tax=Acromyrmex echinatior TaxID=103372 RepID=F4WY79_ACREC|nr:PREDICTED: serine/threonine-protein phosphatase 6 regulatory subunit 3 isoform X1 [Acromyrmex echinatior]EGI60836.1 Serine/threonine-protein phosphatase 6 regulatory subunit 2 [Acromyrmex echinatior]
MFWTNNYVSSPHIEALLNKEDVTLHELMDEEDILQECKSQNKKLVEYLTRPAVMEELVTLTTKEPSTDIEERWRYKYPNVACELLTCDVPTLNEKLAGDEALLAKLYSFIDTDQPLNPLLASFFSKTIGVLVARKSDQNWYSYQFTCLQVLEFLKSRQRCVDLLLQHLETSAIMDLVLKLVTQVEGSDMRQNILNWLDSQHLVQRLVKLLAPTSEVAKHANAAQLLCDMVTVARETQRTSTERADPDPILNTLESGETVSLLLETILTAEKVESSIVGGIQVLLVLLGQRASNTSNEGDVHGNSEDTTDNEQCIKISNATLPYLEHLHKLLLEPPYKPAVKTTVGLLECPLGNTRLHVAKLLSALLATENLKIHESLETLGTFQTLLDLFFKYTWNNFLHTQVQQCLALAINCGQRDNDIIYNNIFIKCKLIERILEAWDKNESKQNKENGVRQGYMGHLINIANNIVTQCEKNNILTSFLKNNVSPECLTRWENLVSVQLVEINKIHQTVMMGDQTPDVYLMSSEENPNEYNSYSQETYIQQMYSNYQGQQITPPFIENFGFHDDEFNDGDDALHNPVDQLTTLAFNLSEEDLDKREDMFNKLCQQKQKAGLEDCGSGLEWGDEGELTFQTVVDKRDWHSKQQHQDSSSSDDSNSSEDSSSSEEEPRTNMNMEVETTDPWNNTEPPNTILPPVNPWDVASSEPIESTGWANFENFENTLSIENTVSEEKKPCDELKEKISEVTAVNLTEKNVTCSKSVGDGNEKSTDYVDSQVVEMKLPAEEINLNDSKSDEHKMISANENVNSELSVSRDFKDTENIETVKDTKNVENEKSSIEQVPAASLESTSTSTVDAIPVPKDAK